MNQVIDFSTLTWVKNELDATLKEARQALEAHVENPQDEAQLGFLADHLHQVYGTLQMVELYGASLLAEEMEQVARAIADRSISQHDEACEVLMRATLQLPDYLDRLIAGHRDIPLVLLPLLNDMRAIRGENLLSENSMFTPDINAALPESLTGVQSDGDVQQQARELRHRFQLGLLGWFRGNNAEASLDSMREVLDSLQSLRGDAKLTRLWWVAAGTIDAMKAGQLDSSIALKRLLGQVDREIKRVIDQGEAALVEYASEELFKNLLFYTAQPPASASERVAAIQANYRLKELLPDENELAEARESLTGQNADLFATVAVAVKEELARLKDNLDIVLRNGCSDSQELEPLTNALRSLADTLGMLSLGAARKAVVAKADDIQSYMDAGNTPADTSLMDVASTLLFVESSVDSMGAGRAVAGDEGQVEDQLAKNEYSQVMDVVVQEAIADLIRAKDAIIEYTGSEHDVERLAEVPQWFGQVKGGLLLLGEARAAALVDSIARYIEKELIEHQKQAGQAELDALADAVCGLEYYLESRKEHRMYGHSAMAAAEEGVDRLGYPADEEAAAVDSSDDVIPDSEPGQPSQVGMDDAVEESGSEVAEADSEPGAEAFELDFSLLDEPGDAETGAAEAATDQFDVTATESDEDTLEQADTVVGFEPEIEAAEEDAQLEEVMDSDERAPEMPAGDVSPAPVMAADTEEDDGLAIIGEDLDEEILEIFIEEAEEELASMGEQLPVWLANAEDSEALGTIRRSYHTLKGSGRLVGAMRIGEFAWAFENMLNRLIDGTITASPALKDLLQSAMQALPELVEQIKQATPTQQPIAYLMRCADALGKGEAMPEAATVSTETVESVAAAEQEEAVPEADIAAADTAEADVADMEAVPETAEADDFVEPSLELEGTTLPIDDAQPVTGSSDVEEGPETEPEAAVEADLASSLSSDGVMDPLLYEIFNIESQSHLEVVRQFLNRAALGDTPVDDELARALHTLHGSAHMADADEIAELAGELEHLLKAFMGAGQSLTEEVCEVLQDSAVITESMLSSLPENHVVPENYAATLQRVKDLFTVIPAANSEVYDLDDSQVGEPVETVDGEDTLPADDCYADHDQELLEIFLEEAAENLAASDEALHQWRDSAEDGEALSELQRALHTLKGGARMADLAAIGDVAHAVESLITAIVDGSTGGGGEAMDGVQRAQDCLAAMLDRVRTRQPVEAAEQLIAELNALRTPAPAPGDTVGEEPAVEAAGTAPVEVSTDINVEQDPYAEVDPELMEVFLEEAGDIMEHSEETLQNWKHDRQDQSLMAELQRELHTLKGGARMADITEIGDLAHAVESLMVKLNEEEAVASDSAFAVLQQAHDRLASLVEGVRNHQPLKAASDIVANLEKLRNGQEVDITAATEEAIEVAVEAESEHRERRAKSRSSQELVRVKADLLDNMVNYAGEVSIYRSRLEQQVGAYRFNLVEMEQTVLRVREQLRKLEIETEAQVLYRYEREGEVMDEAAGGEDFDPLEMDRYSHMQQLSRSLVESVSDLSSIQGMLDNITRESETLLLQQSRVNTELQEGLMRTRMVPFLGLAARMRRIVRQTAQELNKQAELELSGAEGEMDRTVVDRIVAPLEHMLRNALSHGIETPEERIRKGKPEAGTIRITLERESSDVVLRIADDGTGINLEAIRKKAVQRGLMTADADLTDNEVLQFILETGFSTAEKVTQVAGRGVGMDVVNSEVKQLGGSLHIDSEYGKGTTFTIRLPFTLALNQALLIEVGEDTYAIPLSSIQGIVRMRREDLKEHYADPDSRFAYGGYEYEVRHLGSVLGTGVPYLDGGQKRLPALLARVGDHCVAFHVENLLGSREIVVKSVGPQISTVRGVSGATILGDGRVVMILDIAALLRTGISALDQFNEIIQQPLRTEGLTVMVVDDSITVRKVTTRLLERNDMNVIAAKDGVDAVSKLQENIPDIMLLDIEMPRMDGFELATHVRNEPRLRDIPIIMITSRTGDKHRQRAMQIGVNRYLGKPFQESDLLENIEALLEETRVDG